MHRDPYHEDIKETFLVILIGRFQFLLKFKEVAFMLVLIVTQRQHKSLLEEMPWLALTQDQTLPFSVSAGLAIFLKLIS
jgi:hypothetical protein